MTFQGGKSYSVIGAPTAIRCAQQAKSSAATKKVLDSLFTGEHRGRPKTREQCYFNRNYNIPTLTITFHYRSKERLQNLGIIAAEPERAPTQPEGRRLPKRERSATLESREDRKRPNAKFKREVTTEAQAKMTPPNDDPEFVMFTPGRRRLAPTNVPEIIDLTKD
ncbi:hypothetical protein CC85DRAFT_202358 [Cutaneotrichosporon oleaginosum]|uniref:Uncharacterized protein n=1 Tax=Cutaneotrichosporon oleaginosum TaxID=879819 RepID=A0A0J0XUC6_9TREE|nr:uncharacterized protein CC85DRAFT_202358 [Cutaneotrichosporon oleaginosum]KLT44701.1 hypothetical protein CC85DRAFT_202358 [Cutaneotrichosporon oleaginosum]TXT07686.1 hypothetical protein COLE_04610 [Cutaneotrichosporon oleaginosum]